MSPQGRLASPRWHRGQRRAGSDNDYTSSKFFNARRVLCWLLSSALASACLYTTWIFHAHTFRLPFRGQHLPSHRFDAGHGLLLMNDSPELTLQHPILLLISRAEKLWKEKTESQSRTLEEAYHEYRRRYKRRPPRGFDMFSWCRNNSVQLLDEFDQVHTDLEMFWAVPPAQLHLAQAEAEKRGFSFTIGKDSNEANISIVAHTTKDSGGGVLDRVQLQIDLLEDVQQHIPPFRATWSLDDGPSYFLSWEMKEAARKAIANGTHVDTSTVQQPPRGWPGACPPGSALRAFNLTGSHYRSTDLFLSARPKSFIADLRASMDPCNTPELVLLSTLDDYGGGPQSADHFVPVFTRAKTMMNSDILGIPLEESVKESEDDIPWNEKNDSRVLWRGSTTGRGSTQEWERWRMSERLRFVKLTNRVEGNVTVLLPPPLPTATNGTTANFTRIKGDEGIMAVEAEDDADRIEEVELPLKDLNKLFDTGFVQAIQCNEEICDLINENYAMKDTVRPAEGKHYKYIMDMDGNAWSSRFRRIMARNAVVFKATVYPEWWTDRSVPWVHYVPVKMDFSDLFDTTVFFLGMPDGSKLGRDDLAEKIAMAGRHWVENFWRTEDVIAYTWRMYLEFARVMSDQRDEMDFVLELER